MVGARRTGDEPCPHAPTVRAPLRTPPLHDLHHLREPQALPHPLRTTSLNPTSPTTCNRPEEPPWPLSPGFAKTQMQPPPT